MGAEVRGASAAARQLRVAAAGLAGPEVSAALAKHARAELARVIASGEAPDSYRRFVDGRQGAPEEEVRPDGVILYVFDYIQNAAAFALSFLVQRSPISSGAYRRGFWLASGLGGRMIPAASVAWNKLDPSAPLYIGNFEPYSRKLDVQFLGGRKLQVSVPPGIFEDAAGAVNDAFGAMVRARRSVVAGTYHLKTGRRQGQDVQSPVLIIEARR